MVVHGGTAVDPPFRRQQVLHVVLLFSESRHESLVVCLIRSRFSFCFEAGIIVCCPQVVAYSHAIYLDFFFIYSCVCLLRIGMVHFTGD